MNLNNHNIDLEEQNYYKPKKFNKPYIGLILGLIFPVLWFFVYYYLRTKLKISFMEYYNILIKTDNFLLTIFMSVLPNLLLFVIFKKLDYWYSIKGVILAIFIYTLLVIILKFSQ